MDREEESGLFRKSSESSDSNETSGLFRNSQMTSFERFTKSVNENMHIEISQDDND